MSPFIHGAFAPIQSEGNEQVCVENRVAKFAAKAKTIVMTSFLDTVMREFARHLVPHAHLLHPVDMDEIYRKQSKPSQRHILDRSMFEDADRVVKMFVKKEAYPDVKDPRPISQINGVDKRDYSSFMYALGDLVKGTSWYAFGTTPVVIANRVVELLEHAATCVNTDFSRFDGRVSPVLRELERIVLMRAFDPLYSEQLNELHLGQYNLPAIGRLGTKYFTGTARASGSPETALFNSLSNAFVAYLTFRSTRNGGVFIGPDQAWHMLGVYGGDDGLTADIDPVNYSKCALSVGMKLDAEEVRRGDMGVKFLARVYGPNVWHGDHNSCCDLVRQLSKFHTTVALPPDVSPVDKLLEKARAYALTDASTPVLGAFVNRVVDIAGFRVISDLKPALNIWNSNLSFEYQYPNQDSGWMSEYALSSLGALDFDFSIFNDWLATVDSLDKCLTPPLCAVPKVASTTQEVVVDGDLLQPAVVVPKAKSDNNKPRNTPVRRGRARAPSRQRTVRFASGQTG
jgi:hypothetical protein